MMRFFRRSGLLALVCGGALSMAPVGCEPRSSEVALKSVTAEGDAAEDAGATAPQKAEVPSGNDALVPVQILAFNDFHGNLEPPAGGSGLVVAPADDPVLDAGTEDAGVRRVPDAATGTRPAGGAAYLAAHIKRWKAAQSNTLVVSAGDLTGASPLLSNVFRDEPTVLVMNAMGLDVEGVGNHDFDRGVGELMRLARGGPSVLDGGTFPGARFQYLAANVNNAQKQTIFPAYVLKEFGGIKVGVVGLTLEDTPAVTVASAIEGLQFRREVDVVNAAVGELRDQNASAVVVVLHQGGFQDEKGTYDSCSGFRGDILPILQGQDGVPGLSTQVDVLVTGHTHQAYNCLLPREGAAPLLVTSAASYGRLLTKIDLLIDPKSKRVASKKAKNVAVTRDVTPDPEVLKIVEEYKEKAAPVANRIVGYLQGDLVADPATLASRSCETTMGDVIADAQLHATKSEGAQMAFMNPGGIRGDLIPRPDKSVTYSQVFGVQPFGNLLVTMDLLGSEIHTLLTQQFAGASPRILQVSSGFTYAHAFDPASGKVEISRLSLGGKPIEDARTYRVTVNSFLAAGADSFKVLEKGRRRVTGSIDVDALVAYLGTMSTASQPLATPKANRIQGNACAARP